VSQRVRPRIDLSAIALADLTDDIDELVHLAAGELLRLRRAQFEVERARHAYLRRTLVTELAQLRSAETTFCAYSRDLRARLTDARRGRTSIQQLRRVKSEYTDLIRLQQTVVAALTVGSDWHSPVFEHSGHPTAGRHSGFVTEHVDDYKRDRHPQARALEESYLREYVETPPSLQPDALMTSCGMAAFTTILHHVCALAESSSTIVAGKGMYHECRRLLAASSLGPRVRWVDEAKTAEVVEACRSLRPAALFLDSMCNSRGLVVPDIQAIMLELVALVRNDVCLVIDNTCASMFFQPLSLGALNQHIRPMLFESLTKYAQFGLDRVAAGMIIAPKREAAALDALREHLGTNISDVCASVLPEPNHTLLSRRLRRLERNAHLLAEHVAMCAANGSSPMVGALYPGLDTHRSNEVARRLGFAGGFFAMQFRPEEDSAKTHGKAVGMLIREARLHKVNLVAGASFGLNVTRIYRTATKTDSGPFVRVAPGTEDRLEVERLKDVFSCVLAAR
jgi:cystathionine beta-lyase/cystathionine gamma-synthase